MNLEDLKQEWNTQNRGTDLILTLYQESRERKAKSEFKRIATYSALFTLLNLLINIYTWLVLIQNFSSLSIRLAGISMLVLTYTVFFKNVKQLSIVSKINNSKPIIEVQKLIGTLKVSRIRHNRFLFIFSNLFFWLLVILVFKWDLSLLIQAIWEKAAIVPTVHIAFAVLWFPLAIWILKKYDSETESSKFWNALRRDSMLTDQSINTSLNNALRYLEEIEAFEKENQSPD